MLYQTTIVIRQTNMYVSRQNYQPISLLQILGKYPKKPKTILFHKKLFWQTPNIKNLSICKTLYKPPHTVVIDPTNIKKSRQNYWPMSLLHIFSKYPIKPKPSKCYSLNNNKPTQSKLTTHLTTSHSLQIYNKTQTTLFPQRHKKRVKTTDPFHYFTFSTTAQRPISLLAGGGKEPIVNPVTGGAGPTGLKNPPQQPATRPVGPDQFATFLHS